MERSSKLTAVTGTSWTYQSNFTPPALFDLLLSESLLFPCLGGPFTLKPVYSRSWLIGGCWRVSACWLTTTLWQSWHTFGSGKLAAVWSLTYTHIPQKWSSRERAAARCDTSAPAQHQHSDWYTYYVFTNQITGLFPFQMSLNATAGVSERDGDGLTHNNTDNSTDIQADHNIYSNNWNNTAGL